MRLGGKIAVSLTALSLAACGWFGTKKKGTKAVQVDFKLAGQWRSNCVGADVLKLAHASMQYNFSALADYEKKETFYSDAGCAEPAFSYKTSGTYAEIGKHEGLEGAKDINFTIQKASLTVHAQDILDELNSSELCGIKDWTVGREVDITNKDCQGFTVKPGDTVVDVYKLGEKELVFGKKIQLLASDDADSRPSSLATDAIYRKQ